MIEKCDLQLTNSLNKLNDNLKCTITVNQQLGGLKPSKSNLSVTTSGDTDEYAKRATIEKLSMSANTSGSKQLDSVVNLGSNIVDKATSKIKTISLNDNLQLPLEKEFLDYIMDVIF